MSKNKNKSAYKVGEKVFIRTITMYYTGRVVKVTDGELVLKKAAWIPDTKRFMNTLEEGDFNEVEPYPDEFLVIINKGAIVDCCNWPHDLPRIQK